jgi:hypothetical protein
MITINKNTSNILALTLTEKSQLTGNTFNLFVFTNQSTGVEKIFTAIDTSLYPQRYNKFEVIESDTQPEDLYDGKINISGNTGQWTYAIYESATPFSAGTLAISATTGTILEIGRVQLDGLQANNTINNIYL